MKSKVDTLDFDKLNPVPTFSLPKTDYDAKISEIKGEIPITDGLLTTAASNAVDNEITDFSDLVKKTNHAAKLSDIESKYFTTSDYNKLTSNILDTNVIKKLVNESDISGFINNFDLDKKRAALAAKTNLDQNRSRQQDKIVKWQPFDSSSFRGKSHFEDDGTPDSLVFQLIYRFSKMVGDTNHISVWKSKKLSDKELNLLLHLIIVLLYY